MIDITPYEDRLRALSDYMNYFICYKECQRKVMDIYNETGFLLKSSEYFQPFCVWVYYHGHNYLPYID